MAHFAKQLKLKFLEGAMSSIIQQRKFHFGEREGDQLVQWEGVKISQALLVKRKGTVKFSCLSFQG